MLLLGRPPGMAPRYEGGGTPAPVLAAELLGTAFSGLNTEMLLGGGTAEPYRFEGEEKPIEEETGPDASEGIDGGRGSEVAAEMGDGKMG